MPLPHTLTGRVPKIRSRNRYLKFRASTITTPVRTDMVSMVHTAMAAMEAAKTLACPSYGMCLLGVTPEYSRAATIMPIAASHKIFRMSVFTGVCLPVIVSELGALHTHMKYQCPLRAEPSLRVCLLVSEPRPEKSLEYIFIG